jgi:hypothetical protein
MKTLGKIAKNCGKNSCFPALTFALFTGNIAYHNLGRIIEREDVA